MTSLFTTFALKINISNPVFVRWTLKKKIIRNDVLFKEEELDDNIYIYNWFLKDKLRYYLKHDFQFFIEIAKEINLIS